MKGSDGHVFDSTFSSKPLGKPLSHLCCRLVCKCDSCNLSRRHVPLLHKISYFVYQGFRFSCSRSCDDRNRPVFSSDRLLLFFVDPCISDVKDVCIHDWFFFHRPDFFLLFLMLGCSGNSQRIKKRHLAVNDVHLALFDEMDFSVFSVISGVATDFSPS